MKWLLIIGLCILLSGCGFDTYEIHCYDADNPEQFKLYEYEAINKDVATTHAMRDCHNGINNIVIKVKLIQD